MPCSEEEARMKIYSVSTRHYYAFGALVSEELSYKLKGDAFLVSHFVNIIWLCVDLIQVFLDGKEMKLSICSFIHVQNCPRLDGCFLIPTWMLKIKIMEVGSDLYLLLHYSCDIIIWPFCNFKWVIYDQ